jgi:hypothetical protein
MKGCCIIVVAGANIVSATDRNKRMELALIDKSIDYSANGCRINNGDRVVDNQRRRGMG